jgi:carotenoid cleavage dioxygenase-like enzyme
MIKTGPVIIHDFYVTHKYKIFVLHTVDFIIYLTNR